MSEGSRSAALEIEMYKARLVSRDSSGRLDLSPDEVARLITHARRLRIRFIWRLARRNLRAIEHASGRVLHRAKRRVQRIIIALERRRIRNSAQPS
jgi:hypothetical protein